MKELIFQSLFFEIAALLVLAAVIGLIGNLLRQPLIVSFIAAGIVAGPSALDIARSTDKIGVLSELGIAVLLFFVGLKLDIKLVRSLGGVALMTGLGQVVFTAAVGYLICVALGLGAMTGLYVAVALAFSSTIIIVKLLSDKRETEALHGQIERRERQSPTCVARGRSTSCGHINVTVYSTSSTCPANIAPCIKPLMSGFRDNQP